MPFPNNTSWRDASIWWSPTSVWRAEGVRVSRETIEHTLTFDFQVEFGCGSFIWHSIFHFEYQSRIYSWHCKHQHRCPMLKLHESFNFRLLRWNIENKQTDDRFEVEKKNKIDLPSICNHLVTLTPVIFEHRRVECFAREKNILSFRGLIERIRTSLNLGLHR